MSMFECVRPATLVGICAPVTVLLALTSAQDNSYQELPNWIQPPASRTLGAVSWAYPDSKGNIWIAERCGQNGCLGRDDLSPILSFDPSGRLIKSFGAGMFVWPHGIFVDQDDNIWVTDARSDGRRGHQVIKFSSDGAILMRLGEAGVAGDGTGQFNGPTDVAVASNGDIFVADGHEADSNNRVLKFSRDGKFLKSWGGTGSDAGEFNVPHALATDSRGRLFVADRNNNRIQVFDQEGVFLEEWSQFGRATGLYIAADDTLFVSDNQSNTQRNPGWRRGIHVGSARDGLVTAFIPDRDFDPENAEATGAHGLCANAAGEIFGAEVGAQTVRKYVRR